MTGHTSADDLFPNLKKPESPKLFSVPGADDNQAESEVQPTPQAEKKTEAKPQQPKTEKPMTTEKKAKGRKRKTEKLCPRCGEVKPIEEFPLIKADDPKQRRRPRCAPCWPEYQKEYRAEKLKGNGEKKTRKKASKKATAKKTSKKKVGRKKKATKKVTTETTSKKKVGRKKYKTGTRKKATRKTAKRRTNGSMGNPLLAAQEKLSDLRVQKKAINEEIVEAKAHLAKVKEWWNEGKAQGVM